MIRRSGEPEPLLRRSFRAGGQPALAQVGGRSGCRWVTAGDRRFLPVLARTWHDTWMQTTGACDDRPTSAALASAPLDSSPAKQLNDHGPEKLDGITARCCGCHMDDKLATPATRIKFRILVGKPGELRLEDGFIAFTLGDGSLVFRAPLHEVRASFPKVTFFGPFPLFGTGINLAVGGNTYRLVFVPIKYKRWGGVPSSVTSVRSIGPDWSFSGGDVEQARAAVRQWRPVLGQPA